MRKNLKQKNLQTETVKKTVKKLYPYIEKIPRDRLFLGYIKDDKLFRQPFFKVYEKDNKWFFEYKMSPRFVSEIVNISGHPKIDIGEITYLEDRRDWNYVKHQKVVKVFVEIIMDYRLDIMRFINGDYDDITEDDFRSNVDARMYLSLKGFPRELKSAENQWVINFDEALNRLEIPVGNWKNIRIPMLGDELPLCKLAAERYNQLNKFKP